MLPQRQPMPERVRRGGLAVGRYGEAFAAVLRTATIWLNGEAARQEDPCGDGDEIAVLPRSGGEG